MRIIQEFFASSCPRLKSHGGKGHIKTGLRFRVPRLNSLRSISAIYLTGQARSTVKNIKTSKTHKRLNWGDRWGGKKVAGKKRARPPYKPPHPHRPQPIREYSQDTRHVRKHYVRHPFNFFVHIYFFKKVILIKSNFNFL